MAPPPEHARRARKLPVLRGILALVVVGVGVSMIVNSGGGRSETVRARLSASVLPFSHAEEVDFRFEDGSTHEEVSPAEGFFEAVQRFGPGPARVTRNASSGSIYSVVFHGKTYKLNDPGGNLGVGIIVVVLGLLGLAYTVLLG